MKLKSLLEGVPIVSLHGSDAIEIDSVTADSRECGPGALFVAVPGLKVDGATFLESAMTKGAAAVVTERPDWSGARNAEHKTVVRVKDAREALALIAANFYGRPAKQLSLIGVTGTSGKTTTTKMVESILDATAEPVGLIGTIEYRAGSVREVADRTTPDAAVLQHWFSRMVQERVRYAVMEVSSHALVLKRTHGVPFAAAVFTNLSRDHFDFHKDAEDYFGAKRMLFEQIDRSRRSAIVNYDDPYGQRLIRELGSAVVSFGRDANADIHPAPNFQATAQGLDGKLITPFGTVNIRSPLLGMPNLYNWMAAIGAALALDISPKDVERGVAALQSVRGRFERVSSPDGVLALVDYAHKPDALEKLLHAVRGMAPGRKIILVFGCGGDRDAGKRPLMGEIAGRMADLSIITSDNPRTEDPAKILEGIEAGIRRVGNAKYQTIPDRRQAIERAIAMADPSSVVVVAGKGHENYQVIGDRIVHFDDREEVEQALAARTKAAR
jgi:UDP-N-acetylmuramoyl-L-alanyl-D-glutamate--2,6-diaminopimelate ligase